PKGGGSSGSGVSRAKKNPTSGREVGGVGAKRFLAGLSYTTSRVGAAVGGYDGMTKAEATHGVSVPAAGGAGGFVLGRRAHHGRLAKGHLNVVGGDHDELRAVEEREWWVLVQELRPGVGEDQGAEQNYFQKSGNFGRAGRQCRILERGQRAAALVRMA